MPRPKHRRRGKSRRYAGQVRADRQRVAERVYDVAEAIYDQAREWDWATRPKGHQGGVIGRSGMYLLREILFVDWLNARSKPLEASIEALASGVGLSRSTVTKALPRLRELGVLDQREIRREGRRPIYVYAVRPPLQWVGYHEGAAAPAVSAVDERHPAH